MSFSSDGLTLASGGWDDTVRLWDVESGQQKAVLQGHTGDVTSVSYSPDGRTLASGSLDETVRLWDVDSFHEKATLEGHTDWVKSVVFSPDGRTLVSGSSANRIRLWDVASGEEKAILEGHRDDVQSVSFSRYGRILASGSSDGTILLWDMAPYVTPSVATAIDAASPSLPVQTALLANYPNPFNPETWIPFQLHAPAQVRLSIYDVRGARVRQLDLGYRAAGQYRTSAGAAHWDGRDQHGAPVASGVYVYRLQAGPVAQGRKMLLVR